MKKNKTQKEKTAIKKTISNIFVILLMCSIVVAIFGYYAYSRYKTTLEGNGQASVAKWSFKVNIGSKEITNDFPLAQTRTDDKADMVNPTTIAPGTYGVIEMELDAIDTEVSLVYEVKLHFTNKPKNLHLYKDSKYEEELFVEGDNTTIIGEIDIQNENKKDELNIYWNWPFETGEFEEDIEENDIYDTSYMEKDLNCKIEVIGVQTTPGENVNTLAKYVKVGDYVAYDEGSGYTYVAAGDKTGVTDAINSEDVQR